MNFTCLKPVSLRKLLSQIDQGRLIISAFACAERAALMRLGTMCNILQSAHLKTWINCSRTRASYAAPSQDLPWPRRRSVQLRTTASPNGACFRRNGFDARSAYVWSVMICATGTDTLLTRSFLHGGRLIRRLAGGSACCGPVSLHIKKSAWFLPRFASVAFRGVR